MSRCKQRDFGVFARANGARKDVGMLEAVPEGPLVGMTLDRFLASFEESSPQKSYIRQGEHSYRTTGGRLLSDQHDLERKRVHRPGGRTCRVAKLCHATVLPESKVSSDPVICGMASLSANAT